MMYLLVDAGNTRIKYGCHDGNNWLLHNSLVTSSSPFLLPSNFLPQKILISNVAGNTVRQHLAASLRDFDAPVEWLHASQHRCGLHCGYGDPAQLGPDRWAAAIAAWQLMQTDCLVVCAGTATTIDLIRSPGLFTGGCILPGYDMMRESLARNTAALPHAEGMLLLPPTNTHDAISSGCRLAQLGAIEKMYSLLPTGSPILLAGGGSECLKPYLGVHTQLHPWLVLEGLLEIARCNTTEGIYS